ncbi:hypothetical protein C2E23DRAFT_812965 [Lenzites betulinus]|nr:hypothetical protein C2E23DRAFT_812965 [Lenzites betulinus]
MGIIIECAQIFCLGTGRRPEERHRKRHTETDILRLVGYIHLRDRYSNVENRNRTGDGDA